MALPCSKSYRVVFLSVSPNLVNVHLEILQTEVGDPAHVAVIEEMQTHQHDVFPFLVNLDELCKLNLYTGSIRISFMHPLPQG